MKILMIAPYPYPDKSIKGGVETVTYNLGEGFRHLPEAELLILSVCHDKDEEIRLSPNVTVRFIKSISPRKKVELRKHIRPKILSIDREWQPDIIHIQGNGSSLLLYDKSISRKLVVTQHGIIRNEIHQTKRLRTKLNMLMALMIEKRWKGHIKNWVFISEYNKRLFGPKIKKINSALIYNPVNPNYFQRTSGGRPKVRELLFVGRIVPMKGLKDLLQALNVKELKEKVILHVVGGFEDVAYRSEITDYISAECLGDCVRMHGWLASEDIIGIECGCTSLVLPSHQENLPCVIAEAMAMGKPVISTKVGGIPEMVDEGRTGFLFQAGDLEGLRKIILELCSLSQEELDVMSESALKKAMALYDPRNVARQHIEFYRRIMRR